MRKYYFVFFLILIKATIFAQFDGPRTYWALPKNFNVLATHLVKADGNASINNFTFIYPNANISSNLYMLSYTRSQPIFGRTFYSTLVIPAGSISAVFNASVVGAATAFQHGMGDITWTNSMNILGAKGLMIKDYVRHEAPLLIYLRTSIVLPTGRYEPDNLVNIGSNQNKLKIGFPIVKTIGTWVDGKRMTLEVSPSYMFISKNNNFRGMELKQKGVFTIETHITRDITRNAFVSLDYSYIKGGDSDFYDGDSGVKVNTQDGQNAHLVGITVNYNINDNLNLFLTHNQSFASGNKNVSLEGAINKITLAWSFHDFQEKFKSYMESN